HLEEAAVVAEDLAARDLAVPRDAALVGNLLARQVVLRPHHHRDLGNGEYADGEVLRHGAGGDAESVTGGQATLLAGGGSEARVADHVARGEDVRRRRAERLLHPQGAPGHTL